MNQKYDIEELNKEYKKLIDSKEYKKGRSVLKVLYYLKHFKFIELFKRMFNRSKYKKYVYSKNNFANEKLFVNNNLNTLGSYDFDIKDKIVVYTVIIGKYDNIQKPLYTSERIDYVLVSDVKPENLNGWNWVNANNYLPDANLSNVKKARYLKTHPHKIFSNYKYSIFMDGNIRSVSNIEDFILRINDKTRIGMHLHPYRDCIYKEIVSCKIRGKGNYNQMFNQIEKYKKEGMPSEFGLFETGVIVREHNNPICIDIMEAWWNEINNNSERDQLSFTYVLWKSGFVANDIGIIYTTIADNPKLLLVNHVQIYDK